MKRRDNTMNHTTQYGLLIKRDQELRRALLPPKRSPTGNYKQSTYERVQGYKLLFHAELEYYFEEITKSIMKNAKDKWDNSHEASPTLVSLMAYCTKSFSSIPEYVRDQHAVDDLTKRINCAYSEHFAYIKSKNHGIKEKNILALLLPIGVEIGDIDNGLLIALNNFGADRGEIAHSTKAKLCATPDDAEATVNNILQLLAPFDSKLMKDYHL